MTHYVTPSEFPLYKPKSVPKKMQAVFLATNSRVFLFTPMLPQLLLPWNHKDVLTMSALWQLRFLKQWCWRFKSFGMKHCVGSVVPPFWRHYDPSKHC